MEKITSFLWFDGNAEEAARFYVSVFSNSRIVHISRYGPEGPEPEGTVMVVNFEVEGQPFIALNGGAKYSFNPAVSFMVRCDSQEEVDRLWAALTEGGQEVQCGWLTDRFGLSWQITPLVLMEMLEDTDPERKSRVMQAMMGMVKLDIATLQKAYKGA